MMPVYFITDGSIARLILEITLYLEYMFIAKCDFPKLKHYLLNYFQIDVGL